MWSSTRYCAATVIFFSVACSGKSSSDDARGSGGTAAGTSDGTGARGTVGGSNGGSVGTGANGAGFCVLGAQGCPCDATGSCARGLSCSDGTCCDATTRDCSVPPASGSGTSGGANTGSGATGAVGGGSNMPKDPGTGGSAPTSVCTPGVVGPVITDCGYPYASDNPLTSLVFNESEVLRAIDPSGGSPLASVRLFYNDEHALTLGVRSVAVTSSSGTRTHDFPVSELTANPGSVRSPQTGTTDLVGDDAGVDPVGRPMWPALFVTDTTADANNRAGDWQMGGTAWNPSAVFGTWKAAVRSVDTTVTPPMASVTPDADPAKNDWNLGGGDPIPASLTDAGAPAMGMPMMGMPMMGKGKDAGPVNEGYGAEVRWDLVLVPGHSYRIQVMVHDGDQNKVGGDTGEACVNFCAGDSCPTDSLPCSPSSPCPVETESLCVNGCCI